MKPIDWIILGCIIVALAIAVFVIIKSKGKTCGCCSKNCPMKAFHKNREKIEL